MNASANDAKLCRERLAITFISLPSAEPAWAPWPVCLNARGILDHGLRQAALPADEHSACRLGYRRRRKGFAASNVLRVESLISS